MFEIKDNILKLFFEALQERGKYQIIINGNSALIKPTYQEEYYKPNIIVKDLKELEISLIHYIETLNEFNANKNILKDYHNLSYFLHKILLNMTATDALDLSKYIDKISYFLTYDIFDIYMTPTLILKTDQVEFYVERVIEIQVFESPYYLNFTMKINNKIYQLPLIRYAIDEFNVCHIFAIQFGRFKDIEIETQEYKEKVNKINSGIKKYRNISPSFVLVFTLFLNILNDNNINKILIPDYLFNRYKKYFKAKNVIASDKVLNRIMENTFLLIKRMEYQFPFFEIEAYPNDIDSYTHIKINSEKEEIKECLERKLKKPKCNSF